MKMSASFGKSFSLSSSPSMVEDVAKVIEKQGIISILGSDCERTKAMSLRKTLSADMSSKKWLSQHGFSRLKKIASVEEFPISKADSSSSSSEGEEEYEGKNELERPRQDDVWWSIQADEEKKKLEKPAQFDNIWSSILSQKANEDKSNLPPPYIHPLVKRSASSLSQKSLEICTESLGSETGSEGFSSHPPSETGEEEEDKEESEFPQEKESQSFDGDGLGVGKNIYCTNKTILGKPFPAPLPSSIAHGDGLSLQMQSRRQNGLLVLEAVAVPSQNNFQAQRQDGRLLLKFVSGPVPDSNHEEVIDEKEDEEEEEEEEEEEFTEVFKAEVTMEDEEEDEEERGEDEDEDEDDKEENEVVEKDNGANEMGIVREKTPKLSSSVINVHKSALLMNKLMGVNNKVPTWNLVKMELEDEEEEEEVATQLPQSLPAPPMLARLMPTLPAATAAYDCFWRNQPSMATMIYPLTQQCSSLKNNCKKVKQLSNSNTKAYEQIDYSVPLLRGGCKEPRRSLIWEPFCIATS